MRGRSGGSRDGFNPAGVDGVERSRGPASLRLGGWKQAAYEVAADARRLGEDFFLDVRF